MSTVAPAPDMAAIYTQFQPKIYGYLYRRLMADVHTLEDLTADVFAKALLAIAQGKGPHTHAGAWLYRIAHNTMIDYGRHRTIAWSEPLDVLLEKASDEPTPFDMAVSAMGCEQIEQAFDKLTDEQKVIVLYTHDGYAPSEIAPMIGKTHGSVLSMLHRGRGKLRQSLQEAV